MCIFLFLLSPLLFPFPSPPLSPHLVSRKGEMFFYLLYGTSFLYQRHVLTVIGYALLPHYGGITWSESFRHVLDTLKERVK